MLSQEVHAENDVTGALWEHQESGKVCVTIECHPCSTSPRWGEEVASRCADLRAVPSRLNLLQLCCQWPADDRVVSSCVNQGSYRVAVDRYFKIGGTWAGVARWFWVRVTASSCCFVLLRLAAWVVVRCRRRR